MRIDSVREFRAKLKEAMDAAEGGETVNIYRGGERFLLVSETAVKKRREAPEHLTRQEYTGPVYMDEADTVDPETLEGLPTPQPVAGTVFIGTTPVGPNKFAEIVGYNSREDGWGDPVSDIQRDIQANQDKRYESALVEGIKPSRAGELPCCAGVRPCKHWVWDSATGEGYKNTLSGRFKEAA